MMGGRYDSVPMTLNSSLWCSGVCYAALAVVFAIGLYGFRTTISGQPILSSIARDD